MSYIMRLNEAAGEIAVMPVESAKQDKSKK
jgi:hypothetical protein